MEELSAWVLVEDVTSPLLQLNLRNLSALSVTWFTGNIYSGRSVYICVYTIFAILKRKTLDVKDFLRLWPTDAKLNNTGADGW